LIKEYEGMDKDRIFKDIFEKDRYFQIDELIKLIGTTGEVIDNNNDTMRFTSTGTIGTYRPENFSGLTS